MTARKPAAARAALSFVAGRAAAQASGIAMGLLFVGSATEKGEEMLAYAHDTQHEKIIRGLALGLALTMYARCELRPPRLRGKEPGRRAHLPFHPAWQFTTLIRCRRIHFCALACRQQAL